MRHLNPSAPCVRDREQARTARVQKVDDRAVGLPKAKENNNSFLKN
jgi:hypothetical protein